MRKFNQITNARELIMELNYDFIFKKEVLSELEGLIANNSKN